jgi:hypothetical protein
MNRSASRRWSVIAFAGAIGFAGAASARPDGRDKPIQQERVGTPPAGAMRMEVRMHAATDGREASESPRAALPDYVGKGQKHVDHGFAQDRAALPVKSDITNRVHIGDREEAGPSLKAGLVEDKPQNRTYEDSKVHPAPIAVKKDIALRVGACGEGDAKAVVKPVELRPQTQTKDGQPETLHADQRARGNELDARLHKAVPLSMMKGYYAGKSRPSGSDAPGDKDAP